MTKRERLEDLGRIYERLENLCDRYDILQRYSSKHSYDDFVKTFSIEENLEGLFHEIRGLGLEIENIYYIVKGCEE